MSGWADWLVANGRADEEAVAQAERVLEAAALRPGDTVLDVGAGLGLLTLAAHERIGDGWVIAVDPSVGALEELLRLAHEVGANGIQYLVGDAEVLPLPDATVDAVVLRSVLVHVADTNIAVKELARVLRPGGRLSLREPLNRGGTYLSTAVDWSPLGELGARVQELWSQAAAADPLMRLDADELAAQLEAASFRRRGRGRGRARWVVTEASVTATASTRPAAAAPARSCAAETSGRRLGDPRRASGEPRTHDDSLPAPAALPQRPRAEEVALRHKFGTDVPHTRRYCDCRGPHAPFGGGPAS
jgi:ubiquinone/menaquinone biosynthesis C-methylase UbiE